MAFGDAFASSRIADEIRLQYATRDVLFIAAAGTYACPSDFVAFPARMEEVVAVAGLTESDAVHPSSCSGPEVDLGAVIGEVPAPGKTQDEVMHFGGSSDATAIVGGVAALVWSEHPDWNRDAVRDQLYRTAGNGFRGGSKGFGRINAYKAVGGFWSLQIDGPDVVTPGDPYTLTARTLGGGPNWAYRWSNGATSPSVSGVGRNPGDREFWSVEATDLRDGMMRRAAHSVSGEDPEARARCLDACDLDRQTCEQEDPPRVGGCGRPYDACTRWCYEHF
jgi:subtilisin family serine protease